MSRVERIFHKGKEIVFLNFVNLAKEEAAAATDEAKQVVKTFAEGACLTLTDVAGVKFDAAVAQAFKDMAASNAPYVRAGALVNVTGFQKVIYIGIISFTKRKLELFETREEALEWLIQQ